MVMLALGYALRRKWAKELPAMPEPDMRTFGLDMVTMKTCNGRDGTVDLLLKAAYRMLTDTVSLYNIQLLCV